MNPIAYHRGSLSAPATARTGSGPASGVPAAPGTRDEPASGARAADYVADIFFIALLAAPFLIFESPGSVPEAVIAARAAPPAISAPARTATTREAAVSREQGPE